jgi:transketolase
MNTYYNKINQVLAPMIANNNALKNTLEQCIEWFNQEDAAYRESVLPNSVKARVSIEAGIAQGWRELIGDCGVAVSLEHFGASASAPVLFKEFGFTPENVASAARESIKKAKEASSQR